MSAQQKQIIVGPELISFASFAAWANYAQEWYGRLPVPYARTVAIDQSGRICASGKEFMAARDTGAFPVCVYAIDPDFRMCPHDRLNPDGICIGCGADKRGIG